jgi:hypothetical protein
MGSVACLWTVAKRLTGVPRGQGPAPPWGGERLGLCRFPARNFSH